MKKSQSFWRRLDDNAERWLLLGFYAMIVATIVVEVVRRFVLSYSSIWGEEVVALRVHLPGLDRSRIGRGEASEPTSGSTWCFHYLCQCAGQVAPLRVRGPGA